MDYNDKITAETWGKLFAVLPKSKVSNLRCVVVCSSGILECPLSWGRGGALFAYQCTLCMPEAAAFSPNAHQPLRPASTQSVERCYLSEETKAALEKVWAGDISKLNM